jgi:hypothetical protein
MQYQMRNTLVLIRKAKKGLVKGLHMPERSAEGVDFFVEGIGPDVNLEREGKDILKVGDQVMLMGRDTETFYPVPGNPNLLVCEEKLIAYIIKEEGE